MGWKYHFVAALRISGDTSPAERERYRAELIRFVGDRFSWSSGPSTPPVWWVDSSSPDLLSLNLIAPGRDAGLVDVRRLSEEFCAEMHKRQEQARRTPDETERALEESAVELRAALRDAQAELDALVASLPAADATAVQRELIVRWRELRPRILAFRGDLAETFHNAQALRAAPDPDHVVVSAEARRQAQQQDAALQQDLRELAVNLAELKLHLLSVWQTTSGTLDRMRAQADELIRTAGQAPSEARADTDLELLHTAGDQYRDQLVSFADAWTARFTELKGMEADPDRAGILDEHQRIRQQLGDFLFKAGKQLTGMRSAVESLRASSLDRAPQHQFSSRVVRQFETLQAAHHQFEFQAGLLETGENFRLDAALRAARGLRRRTQDRIREIDERLSAEATRIARQRRQLDLAEAERRAAALRSDADAAMDQLLALQDSFQESIHQTDEQRERRLRFEALSTALQLRRATLDQLEQRMGKRAQDRIVRAGRSDLSLVSCGISTLPANLGSSLTLGTLAAVASLAVTSRRWRTATGA